MDWKRSRSVGELHSIRSLGNDTTEPTHDGIFQTEKSYDCYRHGRTEQRTRQGIQVVYTNQQCKIWQAVGNEFQVIRTLHRILSDVDSFSARLQSCDKHKTATKSSLLQHNCFRLRNFDTDNSVYRCNVLTVYHYCSFHIDKFTLSFKRIVVGTFNQYTL